MPVSAGSARRVRCSATSRRIENSTIVGEYDRFNGQRMVTLTANVFGEDLGRIVDARRRGDRAAPARRRAAPR